jgi:hypothetical protein
MVKRLLPPLAILATAVSFIACSACTTAKRSTGRTEDLPFSKGSSPVSLPEVAWKHQLEGKLTDLSVADSSGQVLVSEILESISENRTQVSLFTAAGRRAWRTVIEAPVRSQAISKSGDWILLSTYQEELLRLDPASGKILWRAKDTGMCRPMILEKSSQVLCHHDDDASPGLVFQVFDAEGKRTFEQKSPYDSLLLKISGDESRILVGFVKGRIWMLGPDFKKVWEKQLDGEIVDAAVSSPSEKGTFIEASLLLNSAEFGQSLVTLAEKGRTRQDVRQHIPFQQLEMSDNGKWLSLYGNGPRGQAVAQYETEPQLQEKWSYHSPKYADYNLKMDLVSSWTMLGFENVADRTRYSHVIALDRFGAMQMHIPLLSEEGAYLYSRGVSHSPGMLVVGTDDGVVSAYHLNLP